MPKNIQLVICNRIDDIINVQLLHDQTRELMNERICELQKRISAALTEEIQELFSELDTLCTDLESYSLGKVYRIGLTDGMQIGEGSI